jgi:hypothetical protein
MNIILLNHILRRDLKAPFFTESLHLTGVFVGLLALTPYFIRINLLKSSFSPYYIIYLKWRMIEFSYGKFYY